ncbi:MAG TPA: HAMP domain-containing sensor histidine kinase [Roseiflexaceae bacterium]|nr:HAMP domain-containing sensor histidine kinase [Roseiflexaceae bacterium]
MNIPLSAADIRNLPADMPGGPPSIRPALWIALLGIGPALLLPLWIFPQLDAGALYNPLAYVLIAGETSLLGVALALLVLRVAYRMRDGRLFLVGMGFLSSASLFFVNYRLASLEEPAGGAYVTSWSMLISLVLGGACFSLSAIDLSPRANRRLMRRAGIWLVVYFCFWLIYSWIYLVLAPTIATPVPGAKPAWIEWLRFALVSAGFSCYAFAVARHYHLYRLRPSRAGIATTCGIALFGEALLAQQTAQLYSLSFWLYHVLQASGFLVISYAVLHDYQRGQSDEGLLESLFLAGTRQRLHADYTQAMEALLGAFDRGETLTPALRQTLQARFGLTMGQANVIERTAQVVADERQQRQTLERLNQTLIEMERRKEELVQMIVHDLKNPLTAQLGFLELLRMVHRGDDALALVEGALRSGRNMSGLIDDLLDVAQLEGGRLRLNRVPILVRGLFEACAEEMRGWGAIEDKTIRVVVPPDLPLIEGDLRLLRRVALNLISNAIKHTPPGTCITLRASHAASCLEHGAEVPQIAIEVEDNGPGIPPERLERIFEKFGPTRGSQSTRQSSSGIGLAFCQLAVEAHGGTIEAMSSVGSGTIVRVVLPVR